MVYISVAISVECQSSIGRESRSIYWRSEVLLWVEYQLTDQLSVSCNSNGNVGNVLVSRCSSSSEVLNGDVSVDSQQHLYNLTPNALPFVTRYL